MPRLTFPKPQTLLKWFQSRGPKALTASVEGVSSLAPFGPITEGLITPVILFSFIEGWGKTLGILGDRVGGM